MWKGAAYARNVLPRICLKCMCVLLVRDTSLLPTVAVHGDTTRVWERLKSASRAADLGSIHPFAVDLFSRWSHTSDIENVLQWLLKVWPISWVLPSAPASCCRCWRRWCGCRGLVGRTALQMSMRTGRPVALKTTYLTGRVDTNPENISPATSSSSC